MATIFLATGFHAAIKEINEHVRAVHVGVPTARATHQGAHKMELFRNKCTLLLSGAPPTQAVRDKAAEHT